MPFPVISDPELQLRDALGLPTFEIAGLTLYKRLALIAEHGMIAKVFYPVFPPDRNAADVLAWLREHRAAEPEPPGYVVRVNLDLVAEKLQGQPDYRVRQVWEWAARGATAYAEMTNLPAPMRELLDEEVPFSSLELQHEAKSVDGTVKALFRTRDGHAVEAVLMRYRDGRRSVCLSSQSGCPLTCTFCATGQMQFRRNLDPWEILDQALHFRRIEPIDHAVFMGMGEPMLNIDAVLDGRAPAPGDRGHAPADDDLDGRLAARADAVHRRGRRADPARDLAARGDRRAAERADARQRPLSARGRARRVPPLRRAPPAQGVRRVRHARGRQRLARARAGARRRCSTATSSRST